MIGVYYASRGWNISKTGAAFSVLVWLLLPFSGYVKLINLDHVSTICWMPGIVALTHRYLMFRQLKYLFILLIMVAMSLLGGHPTLAFWNNCMFAFSILYCLIFLKGVFLIRIRPFLMINGALMISFGLALMQLIPSFYFF